MNMKTRIAKFLITLTSFTMMTSVNAYQGSDCCNPCANYDPCCPSPARSFYGEVDYIYWGVQQDGLRFSHPRSGCCVEQDGCCDDSCGSGCCNNHDLNWNSGFKIGAGMANPCCDWEMFVQYTYYRANPSKCVRGDLVGQWGFDNGFNPTDRVIVGANSGWNFRFNNIDALITNEFCVNNCFSFRPSFGLKGAWLRHKYDIGYAFAQVAEFGSATGRYVCHKQDFWGLGPKFGVTANASLFDCFSIYGNLGLSTLWGSYRLNRNDYTVNPTLAPRADAVVVADNCSNDNCGNGFNRTPDNCLRDCKNRVQSVLETSIGVRWDTELCCGDYGFYVNLAWEQQVWFNHNHFIDLNVNSNHGDLTLQGVTVGAGFSF
jgi:hypothetical protein